MSNIINQTFNDRTKYKSSQPLRLKDLVIVEPIGWNNDSKNLQGMKSITVFSRTSQTRSSSSKMALINDARELLDVKCPAETNQIRKAICKLINGLTYWDILTCQPKSQCGFH
jgi:hypothetical protein